MVHDKDFCQLCLKDNVKIKATRIIFLDDEDLILCDKCFKKIRVKTPKEFNPVKLGFLENVPYEEDGTILKGVYSNGVHTLYLEDDSNSKFFGCWGLTDNHAFDIFLGCKIHSHKFGVELLKSFGVIK